MPEVANVVAGNTIESAWGNTIRDRTVQRYASVAARSASHPSPAEGDVSFLADTGTLDVFYLSAWRHIGPPPGTVQLFAGASVPPGWLLCNGSAVSRTTYAALFAEIGTTWGPGDGTSTFNLPDFRGRYPRGVAATGDGDALGEGFGADTLPNHLHTVDPPSTNSGAAATSGTGGPSVTGSPSDPGHIHPTNIASFNSGNPTSNPSTLPASRAVHFIIRT